MSHISVDGHDLRLINKSKQVKEGDVVIVRTITPEGETYYRGRVHWRIQKTRSSYAWVQSEPDFEWPNIPRWQNGWIYFDPIDGHLLFYTEIQKEA